MNKLFCAWADRAIDFEYRPLNLNCSRSEVLADVRFLARPSMRHRQLARQLSRLCTGTPTSTPSSFAAFAYWTNQSSGDRVSLAEVAENLDDLEPCGRSNCGLDLVSRDGNSPNTWSKSLTSYQSQAMSATSAIRFTLRWPTCSRSCTYCEVMEKGCRDGVHPIAETPAVS